MTAVEKLARYWDREYRWEIEKAIEMERVHKEQLQVRYLTAYNAAALAFDNAHPNYLAAYGEAALTP